MAQEKLLSDYSGGMNALAGVDKLDPKECLLAENVRLDETGSIQSAGAFTHQNTSSYADSTGNTSVHSQYWNPALGAVAGVGQDVFQGLTLGNLASKLTGKNPNKQKMSFASAPNRVYFDVGSVGYWSDMTNLLLVDWVPPGAGSGSTITSSGVGTATQTSGSGFTIPWTNPNGIASTSSASVATSAVAGGASGVSTEYLRATMGTNSFSIGGAAVTGIQVSIIAEANPVLGYFTIWLLKADIPVGVAEIPSPGIGSTFSTLTAGGSSDLWGTTWAQADVNSPNFGVQITYSNPSFSTQAIVQAFNCVVTIYQGVAAAVGTGTTGTLTGTYTWKFTFVAANGEESDGGPESAQVILSGQQGTLTSIPLGDARTVARNVYRKGYATNTPLTLHYLVGTINDNLSTTYSDNQTDIAAITEGVILAGDVPGDFPNSRLGNLSVRFPCYHYDRVFWVNQGQKNQLIWSKPLNGFAYPVVNFINVGDSAPISRIISVFGELIIIKTNSQIWRLTGTDESSFDLTQTPSSIGTDESFTAVALPDKIPFANRFGLWVFNGYTSQPLTNKLDLWFKQEDRTGKSLFGVNGFHPPEVKDPSIPLNFEAVGNSEKYVLTYAEAGETQNSTILIFDLKHGNITKREPGIPEPLSLSIDPVTGFVYMGDNQGFISLLDDWNGTNGGGAAINFDFQHGYQDFQRGSNKALWALEFYLNTNGQSLTPSVYYDNGSVSETLPALSAAGLQRIVRTMEAPNSRKMQNFSWRLNGSLSQVNASGTPQVEVVHVKALWDIRAGRARTGQ